MRKVDATLYLAELKEGYQEFETRVGKMQITPPIDPVDEVESWLGREGYESCERVTVRRSPIAYFGRAETLKTRHPQGFCELTGRIDGVPVRMYYLTGAKGSDREVQVRARSDRDLDHVMGRLRLREREWDTFRHLSRRPSSPS